MAAWWTNSSCSPFMDADTSCTIGPLIRFADEHNIRVVIRNTGHDYLGKSPGAGAIALWMHHLKGIQYEAEYKSPGYTGPAIRVGAGVQGFEAENAAHLAWKVHPPRRLSDPYSKYLHQAA
ncbi:FAD binding domain protein [Penicillium capsulatum]|nr:FAD binding domain protein [Penicillium capsulatum]